MISMYPDESPREVPCLALTPKQAAKALGVSEKTLFNYSTPRGPLACTKLGSRVLYPVAALQAFLSQQPAESEVGQ